MRPGVLAQRLQASRAHHRPPAPSSVPKPIIIRPAQRPRAHHRPTDQRSVPKPIIGQPPRAAPIPDQKAPGNPKRCAAGAHPPGSAGRPGSSKLDPGRGAARCAALWLGSHPARFGFGERPCSQAALPDSQRARGCSALPLGRPRPGVAGRPLSIRDTPDRWVAGTRLASVPTQALESRVRGSASQGTRITAWR